MPEFIRAGHHLVWKFEHKKKSSYAGLFNGLSNLVIEVTPTPQSSELIAFIGIGFHLRS